MIDTNKILEQILGKGGELAGRAGVGQPTVERAKTFARDNPLVIGGIAGLLLGSAGKDVAKLGGLAVLGGLAYKAYRNWQAQQSGGAPAETSASGTVLPPPADSPFAIQVEQSEPLGEALILAMIAAARADGQVDAEERSRIEERLSADGFSAEEADFLRQAFDAPVDIDKIVAAARTREAAVEIYTASLLAARPDTPAERGYLAMLAGRLGLASGLVESIEGTLREARG